MEKIFYQSSLPRSGSTLLQNIMAQNPDFYATPTSGLIELIYGARANYTETPEFKAQDKELMKKAFMAFCKDGMFAYHNAITDKKYVLDKGRSWGIYYDLLEMILGEKPKIICMVRDMRDIMASMEKNFRKNPDKAKSIVNWAQNIGTTVERRWNMWCETPPVGLAIDRLKEIILFGFHNNFLFVKYEDLCLNPDIEMQRIYKYLEVPFFQHNFDFIEQITKEDDVVYGAFGDHAIRNELRMMPTDALQILGRDICEATYQRFNWFYQFFRYPKSY